MTKTRPTEGTKILSIRFPEPLIRKLDRYVKRFQKQFPGISFQRTDAIRLFVERGIKDPITPDHQPEAPPAIKREPSAGKTKP